MKVTIYGGGNIGTQFATHYAETGNEVTMFTSKPEKFARRLTVLDKQGTILHEGDLAFATDDAKEAFSDAVPPASQAQLQDVYAQYFAPLIDPDHTQYPNMVFDQQYWTDIAGHVFGMKSTLNMVIDLCPGILVYFNNVMKDTLIIHS